MRKYIFSIACSLLLTSIISSAQKVSAVAVDLDVAAGASGKGAVTEDKTSLVDITGIGVSTFLTSSQSDNSKQSLRITVSLLTSGASKENFQLIFYSENDRLPFVVASNAGSTYVFYPISLYDAIKSKIEQSLSAKKKIQLKVTLTKEGYREGSLAL